MNPLQDDGPKLLELVVRSSPHPFTDVLDECRPRSVGLFGLRDPLQELIVGVHVLHHPGHQLLLSGRVGLRLPGSGGCCAVGCGVPGSLPLEGCQVNVTHVVWLGGTASHRGLHRTGGSFPRQAAKGVTNNLGICEELIKAGLELLLHLGHLVPVVEKGV